jgi:N-acetylglucosaminyl-diphospho-decaprenol L-rhamnosyltransferase
MKLNLDDITFIIVTYKSENIIQNCLNSLPKNSKKIIIENSNNYKLEKDLKSKYDNIEVIVSNNIGMGAGNNLGLKACKTNYAFVLNPDTKLYNKTLSNFIRALDNVSEFTLASPLNDNKDFPNYKKVNSSINKNILSVESIDGFSMLFNLRKFKDQNFFDENFFLYLENDDLCLRIRKKNEHIYVVTDSLINHKGGINRSLQFEYLRNWHWMWSKFYFNKKHYGFLNAIAKISTNLSTACFKYLIYFFLLNSHKKQIYKMRLCGIIASVFGKKSSFRVDN